MAAVNRCQGFYWLRIYHLTDGAICAPPPHQILFWCTKSNFYALKYKEVKGEVENAIQNKRIENKWI